MGPEFGFADPQQVILLFRNRATLSSPGLKITGRLKPPPCCGGCYSNGENSYVIAPHHSLRTCQVHSERVHFQKNALRGVTSVRMLELGGI